MHWDDGQNIKGSLQEKEETCPKDQCTYCDLSLVSQEPSNLTRPTGSDDKIMRQVRKWEVDGRSIIPFTACYQSDLTADKSYHPTHIPIHHLHQQVDKETTRAVHLRHIWVGHHLCGNWKFVRMYKFLTLNWRQSSAWTSLGLISLRMNSSQFTWLIKCPLEMSLVLRVN